jgi:hypothetical protein
MNASSRLGGLLLVAFVFAAPALSLAQAPAPADAAAVDRARAALAAGNAKQAYSELIVLQDRLSGQPEYDYLLGVASLDSGRIDEAIIAFERVLALIPNHAGAQMDIARAYYAAGSFDLAQAAFSKLRLANPPRGALEAIDRYLDAIQSRKHQTQAGWTGYGELGLGYDSNITGVPLDFGAAALQSFNLIGIEATGNSIKRKAPYIQGAAGAEYSRPLSRGWSVFAGGDARGRRVPTTRRISTPRRARLRIGGALNSGQNQWRTTASYLAFSQEGDAPGEPKPTNDRRMGGIGFDWRHALDTKTQLGLNVQANAVRFPTNEIEDFDQIFVGGSWLKSFERPGVPLLYVSVFGSYDRAPNKFPDGVDPARARTSSAGAATSSTRPRRRRRSTAGSR